ncbi:MAG: carbohydrate-binding domain-containing protein [Bacteroidaceae bacterium]|nr:carbohydrate-binding domain-containing protein [Bacteroidaceae bacterium]
MRNRCTIILLCLVSFLQIEAQNKYYVANNDGTYQAIATADTHQMQFDAEQKVVAIKLIDGITSQFATGKVDSISLVQPAGATELTYTEDFSVAFDENDKSNYNEIVETIITDELVDESGDFIENYSPSKIVTISYTETGVTVTPDIIDQVSYTIVDKTHLMINSSRSKMAYRIQGSCSNGSLKIYSTKKFQLALFGVSLTNPKGPAINIQSGKTVYVTLTANKTNNLCDGEIYNDPAYNNGEEEDQKGTFFSEGQLIFSGTGTLNVKSYGGHAICSDDYIRIRSGNINIQAAAKDGFHTNDIFRVGRMAASAPTITVNASGDGIDCGKGNILIEAGDITVNTVDDGLTTTYDSLTDTTIDPSITIRGGFVKVTTTGEKGMALKSNANFTQTGGIVQAETKGNGSKAVNCEKEFILTGGKLTAITDGAISSDSSATAGIKSVGNCTITDGTLNISCTGTGAKAINCDNNVIIDNGTITLLSTGKNYNAGSDDKKTRAISSIGFTQNGGTVIAKSYDKAIYTTADINVNGGKLNAFSANDYALSKSALQTGGWILTKDSKE